MINVYIAIVFVIYSSFVFSNYLIFQDLMLKEKNRSIARYFWFFLLSGPFLTGFLLYRLIKRMLKKRVKRKKLKEAIIKQLPDLLEMNGISVVDKNGNKISKDKIFDKLN